MMLVNDPPATAQEPDLFGARAMTYYGRWTYKLEEAERQGAAGVILVHTTESASYPWNVVTGSWSGEQYQLTGTISGAKDGMRAEVEGKVDKGAMGIGMTGPHFTVQKLTAL